MPIAPTMPLPICFDRFEAIWTFVATAGGASAAKGAGDGNSWIDAVKNKR